MQAKLLEIRDRATCISALAVKLNRIESSNDGEGFILGREGIISESFIVLYSFSRNEGYIYPTDWGSDTRTMLVVHQELVDNWDKYQTGDVIDVRYILGENEEPAESDRFLL